MWQLSVIFNSRNQPDFHISDFLPEGSRYFTFSQAFGDGRIFGGALAAGCRNRLSTFVYLVVEKPSFPREAGIFFRRGAYLTLKRGLL
jgi:hypothetical protein